MLSGLNTENTKSSPKTGASKHLGLVSFNSCLTLFFNHPANYYCITNSLLIIPSLCIQILHTHTHRRCLYSVLQLTHTYFIKKKTNTNQPNKKPTPKTHPAPEQEFFSLKIENAFVLFFKLTVEF